MAAERKAARGGWLGLSKVLPALVGLAAAAAALWLLGRELRGFDLADVGAYLASLPPGRIFAALALTALGHLALTGDDALALRHVRHRLPYRQTGLVSFIAHATATALGHTVPAGGSVRYRLYTALGVPAEAIDRVNAFRGLGFWVGVVSLGGIVLLVEPPFPVAGTPVSTRLPGALLLVLFGAWLLVNAVRTRPITVWRWTVDVPGWRTTLGQALVASIDLALAAAVLWVLLPGGGALSFGHLLSAFLVAVAVGVVSTVPAGLGVFDAVLVALITPAVSAPVALGAVLAYRGIYYLLPFLVAALALVAAELVRSRAVVAGHVDALGDLAGSWLPRLVPRALAATTFLAGATLLVTGVLPAAGSRMAWLARVVPLEAVEASHFVGSVAGAALLVVARGLWRRRDGAWWIATLLLALGALASLARGADYGEAAVLAVALVLLLPCRRYFTRRSALLTGPASSGWVLAVGLVLLAALWLGLFAYRDVAYADDLWWQFAFRADAPRFLRGMAGASAVVLLAGLLRLLRGAPRATGELPTPETLARARDIIGWNASPEANLALLGDKRLLFARAEPGDADDGFVMFASQGASWIAMGGPVGPEATREALVWEFCGAAEAAGARPVFYGVPEVDLPLVLDLGLAPYKLGEGARVPLAGFSLEGGSKRGLRRTRRKLVDAGCVVEVLPPEAVGALLPELRRVSDAWLGGKATDEKGFSLGVFDETYLRNFPLAVVRAPPAPPTGAADGTGGGSPPAGGASPPAGGASPPAAESRSPAGDGSPPPIVAFANVWANDRIAGGERGHPEAKAEFSLDLMRFDRARAPDSVMEYLFIEMMLWGAAEGYGAFGLGMAPLAGLEPGGEARALAPLWNRFGALLFRHGENFYNFQGLRAYKEKFDPEWSPRYLAVPRGRLELAGALVDVTTLISGGLFGLIPR